MKTLSTNAALGAALLLSTAQFALAATVIEDPPPGGPTATPWPAKRQFVTTTGPPPPPTFVTKRQEATATGGASAQVIEAEQVLRNEFCHAFVAAAGRLEDAEIFEFDEGLEVIEQSARAWPANVPFVEGQIRSDRTYIEAVVPNSGLKKRVMLFPSIFPPHVVNQGYFPHVPPPPPPGLEEPHDAEAEAGLGKRFLSFIPRIVNTVRGWIRPGGNNSPPPPAIPSTVPPGAKRDLEDVPDDEDMQELLDRAQLFIDPDPEVEAELEAATAGERYQRASGAVERIRNDTGYIGCLQLQDVTVGDQRLVFE